MCGSSFNSDGGRADPPAAVHDAREREKLERTVAWLAEPCRRWLSPLAAEVPGQDLARLHLLLGYLNVERSRPSDQRLIRLLRDAYRRLARLRPEDLVMEIKHDADFRKWLKYRSESYRQTRERVGEITEWGRTPVVPGVSPEAAEASSDPALVREARLKAEAAAWAEPWLDELNQIEL